MLKFDADHFIQLGRIAGMLSGVDKTKAAIEEKIKQRSPDKPFDPELLVPIQQFCEAKPTLLELELYASADSCGDLSDIVSRNAPASAILRSVEQFQNVLVSEMRRRVFLALSPTEAEHVFPQAFPFGDPVAKKLPVAEDVIEASKCLGLERSTACVFHLSRAMEVAVRAFGDKLGVALIDSRGKDKVWQMILDEANKTIRSLDQNAALTKQYAAISALLYNVKLAWRNDVMHPKQTYTLEEAKAIYDATKAFMTELASVL